MPHLLDTRMLATFSGNGRLCSDVSATTTKPPYRHRGSQILEDVDVRVWKEVCKFFPVEGLNYQTARMNKNCRMIVATFIRSALRDKDKQFSFNQELLTEMYGKDTRVQIVNYLKKARYFTIAQNYSTGHHSYIRAIKGARTELLYGHQHNIDVFDFGMVYRPFQKFCDS